jgi:hypothetical protein
MEYAEEEEIANDDDEYAVGDHGNNEPLAEGKHEDDDEYASAARCVESITLSATPAESMIRSALAERASCSQRCPLRV